jgi:hypothetical protein
LDRPLPVTVRFLTDAAPIQAEGDVRGRPFYFRARHNAWRFVVSESPDLDPVEIEAEHVAAGQGWLIEGEIGAPREARASFLSRADATMLIEQCAAAYLRERAP